MGIYLNPGNDAFAAVLKKDIYIDKSGLIAYTNRVLNSSRMLTCFSRPRRFGKSYAAKMLAAYYSKGADSDTLFQNLKISKMEGYKENLNQYDVLFLDIAWFISISGNIEDFVSEMQDSIIRELKSVFPEVIDSSVHSLPVALLQISAATKRKFFIIIDEWDALFREAVNNEKLQKSYIQLLRALFKGLQISQFLAGAYMTGILPIKKYGTQSALTDFREFTMLEPGFLAEYVGFTEKEVRDLCQSHQLDFEEANKWYDGYRFDNIGHVYSPNSIMEAVINQKFSNYWTQTETYESLRIYIDMDFDGLKKAIIDMLGGKKCRIDTGTFQNDMTSLQGRDDVLTLLVHLGYLAYNDDTKEVHIPNEEVRQEFIRAIKNGKRRELVKAVQLSDRLLDATLEMDSETVAAMLEEAHDMNTSPEFYNNEQALRAVVIMAYLSCVDHYMKFEELASGKGYSDILFLPNITSAKPALLIELKWDKSASGAVLQMKKKNYSQILEKFKYQGELLLVGINYNSRTKKHSCKIEKYHRKGTK